MLTESTLSRKQRKAGDRKLLQWDLCHYYQATCVVKQWETFLTLSHNMRSLIKFPVTEWKKERQRWELGSNELFLAFNKQCLNLTCGSCKEIDNLKLSQEDAHNRMLLHASYIVLQGFSSIVIHNSDTVYKCMFASIWIETLRHWEIWSEYLVFWSYFSVSWCRSKQKYI